MLICINIQITLKETVNVYMCLIKHRVLKTYKFVFIYTLDISI
jgi:hypothetical protein